MWQALGSLYAQTVEIRHALVHRRVQVEPSTLNLTAFDSNGVALLPLSYDEQMAFCWLAQRVGQAIIEGTLRSRVEADSRKQLADLQRHHGVAVLSNASNRPPVRVIDGLLGLPRLHGQFALGYSTSSQSNVLVFSGAKVAQGGVSSPGVVKALDVFEDRCSQHLSVRP